MRPWLSDRYSIRREGRALRRPRPVKWKEGLTWQGDLSHSEPACLSRGAVGLSKRRVHVRGFVHAFAKIHHSWRRYWSTQE